MLQALDIGALLLDGNLLLQSINRDSHTGVHPCLGNIADFQGIHQVLFSRLNLVTDKKYLKIGRCRGSQGIQCGIGNQCAIGIIQGLGLFKAGRLAENTVVGEASIEIDRLGRTVIQFGSTKTVGIDRAGPDCQ